MDPTDLQAFSDAIGIDLRRVTLDLAGLALIQHAVLATVPLHDLHVFDDTAPTPDAVEMTRNTLAGRGNWRFGANATLAVVLESVGFDVAVSGAALLLDGPNRMIDHIVLEVSTDDLEPHLVDVGIDRSPVEPVRLNSAAVQRLGHRIYQLLPSPQGTTLAEIDHDIPVALLRFRRVSRPFDDFAATVITERERHRRRHRRGPTVTRLLGTDTFDRVTLTGQDVEQHRQDGVHREPHDDWDRALAEWFPTLATGR